MNESKIITISASELVNPLAPETLQRLANDDREPEFSDIPELSTGWLEAARADRDRRRTKQSISIRLDPDIVDFFKSESQHYQTRINAVLRAYVDSIRSSTQTVG